MSLLSERQLAQYRDEGYFVTAPAFEPGELAEMIAEFDRLHAQCVRDADATGEEKRIRFARLRPFIGQAHLKSEAISRFTRAPIYLEICRNFIGPDADLYYNQVVIKPPEGGLAFGWHQDSGYGITEPLEYVTCWTAIGPAFKENGCVWVIPGSHKRGLLEHVRGPESLDAVVDDERGAIPVELEPGQIAVFSSLTLHRSGPNVSKTVRRGFVPQYHVPMVRDKATGQPHGDLFPVLRGGKPVGEAVAAGRA
ncbi:MAG: phytanoyl-CoA dioxygenase family protein [Planctomycetota bacterium]|nr:phytanoyl-CoA dioxygenase family protein [Planctomycetota bacterium]